MQRAFRVVHVLGASRYGGATGVVFSLVDMACSHGGKAEILTDDPVTIEHCQARDIPVLQFHGIERQLRPHKDLLAAIRLARVLKGRYDIVHTHTTKGGAIGRLAARLAGIPLVIHTVHGFAFHEFSAPLTTYLGAVAEKALAVMCDKLIFVNTTDRLLAEKLRIARQDQRVTVYNGIPSDRIELGRKVPREQLLDELGIPKDSFLCVFVGRLALQKGLEYLIEAMAILRRDHPQSKIHLAMVGDGELMEACKGQIKDLALGDYIHLLGFRSNCMQWTGGCDLFVLSSLWEGHSITLLEAMGLGKTIVATDIKGNSESITHRHDGLLVPAADSQALARSIWTLAQDRTLGDRLGAEAENTFNKRFSEDIMKQTTWSVYEDLLRARGLI